MLTVERAQARVNIRGLRGHSSVTTSSHVLIVTHRARVVANTEGTMGEAMGPNTVGALHAGADFMAGQMAPTTDRTDASAAEDEVSAQHALSSACYRGYHAHTMPIGGDET